MPFDGTLPGSLSELDRLLILREIAAKSCGDQKSFHTCLLADCIRDGRLGLVRCRPTSFELTAMGAAFGMPCLFGPDPIEAKRAWIAARIFVLTQMELPYAA